MHAPNHASRVHSETSDFFAGVCRSGCPSNSGAGWFVRYRPVREYADAYDAVINLNIHDLSGVSTVVLTLPFVIDTGTDVTIIPRRLIPSHSFPPQRSLGAYEVHGMGGGVIVGLRYRAVASIAPQGPSTPPLAFGELKPIVVDHWSQPYGMLGLDALRRVVMIADNKHVSFWMAPKERCP
jgi:hypothetical protein